MPFPGIRLSIYLISILLTPLYLCIIYQSITYQSIVMLLLDGILSVFEQDTHALFRYRSIYLSLIYLINTSLSMYYITILSIYWYVLPWWYTFSVWTGHPCLFQVQIYLYIYLISIILTPLYLCILLLSYLHIAVLSLDGILSVFKQDTHAFSRYISNYISYIYLIYTSLSMYYITILSIYSYALPRWNTFSLWTGHPCLFQIYAYLYMYLIITSLCIVYLTILSIYCCALPWWYTFSVWIGHPCLLQVQIYLHRYLITPFHQLAKYCRVIPGCYTYIYLFYVHKKDS